MGSFEKCCVALWFGCCALTLRAETVGLDPLVAAEAFHASDGQLERLIAELIEENPQAEAARGVWRSRVERIEQERSLPDPMVTYRYFAETPETRVGPQRQGLEVSQGLPWFGKRDLAAERAEHVASAVAWQGRDLERSLVAELKRSYYDATYLQEALVVNAEEAALLTRFERIALKRYSTGQGIQQSVIKVQTDLSRLSAEESALLQRLRASRRAIARLIGRPESELTLQPISLELLDLDLDSQTLEEDALRMHAGVRALESGMAADDAWLRRRKMESKPDFRVGLGWIDVRDRDDPASALAPPEDDGQDVWAVSVGVNIPIHRKRIQAGVAEARESLTTEELRLEAVQDRLRYTIQEALLRVESLGERARLYRDVIIPQAEESLASAETAYTTNRQDFLGLLDVERLLFQVRLTYHRLLADYWIALADVEHGLGRRFPAEGDRR